ncbi:MAG TPA: YdcF family protein [Terracidiphilus sp.]|nr:YdcF family protein [Terracidiphilus sp.]
MKRQSNSKPRSSRPRGFLLRISLVVLLVLLAGLLAWCRSVYVQIESYAGHDQAAPSDAIGVFGAAEYDGRPSPVYRARLDHALDLYHHGIAPLIVTLGGNGGDQYSEGAVGREYLEGQGVPEEAIIAETESRNTEESARRIAVIARANGLRRLVIVSDGTHLFRIHEICAADGLDVLTSPRPHAAVEDGSRQFERIEHEILSYTLWRLHLH